eukprot:Gb_01271 [translate_table: standard]
MPGDGERVELVSGAWHTNNVWKTMEKSSSASLGITDQRESGSWRWGSVPRGRGHNVGLLVLSQLVCIRNIVISCMPVELIRFAQEKITAIHGRNITGDSINEGVDSKGDVADSINLICRTVVGNPTQVVW